MDAIDSIRAMPTVIENNHESLYRSYNILAFVKEWCRRGVPSQIILIWVEHMESGLTLVAPDELTAIHFVGHNHTGAIRG